MKTLLIASLVGAIILYAALFMMHAVLSIHDSEFKYATGQDTIMNALNQSLTEDGVYYVPNVPPGTPRADMEQFMHDQMGKPYAIVAYHKAMNWGAKEMIMGFVYNWVAMLILCVMLAAANARLSGFTQRLWFVLLAALFVIFSSTMMSYNWVQMPMHYIKSDLIDIIVGNLLVGIWLAWYYGRGTSKS